MRSASGVVSQPSMSRSGLPKLSALRSSPQAAAWASRRAISSSSVKWVRSVTGLLLRWLALQVLGVDDETRRCGHLVVQLSRDGVRLLRMPVDTLRSGGGRALADGRSEE